MDALGLPVSPTKPVEVRLGDGHKVMTLGTFKAVLLTIGELKARPLMSMCWNWVV